ncbi:MAG: thioredoxin domain-containing protein [Acetobacteraceae bacterium]|nr:thioredoxin domain-containing protein [Acetobacteraceae bacterium]
MAAYDVTQEGNWDGKNILRRITAPGTAVAEAALDQARLKLFTARAARPRPGRDDKVLADWNGLTITALVRAASVFDQPAWLERAAQAFDFILAQMGAHDGRIQHAWRLGRITASGLLDDQAAMARAALALYMATGAAERLAQAVHIAEAALKNFGGPDGVCTTTAADATDFPIGPEVRPRSAADNVTPSGNAMLAEVFAVLFHLTGEPLWCTRTEAILRGFTGEARALSGMPSLLCAADLLAEATTVVVTGPTEAPNVQHMIRAVLRAPDPTFLLLHAPDPAAISHLHPAHGKTGGPAAYICRAGTCSLPIRDVSALRVELVRKVTRTETGC